MVGFEATYSGSPSASRTYTPPTLSHGVPMVGFPAETRRCAVRLMAEHRTESKETIQDAIIDADVCDSWTEAALQFLERTEWVEHEDEMLEGED